MNKASKGPFFVPSVIGISCVWTTKGSTKGTHTEMLQLAQNWETTLFPSVSLHKKVGEHFNCTVQRAQLFLKEIPSPERGAQCEDALPHTQVLPSASHGMPVTGLQLIHGPFSLLSTLRAGLCIFILSAWLPTQPGARCRFTDEGVKRWTHILLKAQRVFISFFFF